MIATNKQGQALGRKGVESRARLLAAARELLVTIAVEKLTASAIARAAGLASQTFYLYFADVDELLLVLNQDVASEAADIVAELADPWIAGSLDEHAARFVAAFYRYWDRNRALLNIRNFRADSGQQAFAAVRDQSTMPIVNALADRIRKTQGAGRVAQHDAVARAVIIISAIERMASRYALLSGGEAGFDSDDLKRAEAYILRLMLSPSAE